MEGIMHYKSFLPKELWFADYYRKECKTLDTYYYELTTSNNYDYLSHERILNLKKHP